MKWDVGEERKSGCGLAFLVFDDIYEWTGSVVRVPFFNQLEKGYYEFFTHIPWTHS